ncbi:helix-turn-helix domain-containing protein [Roseovarius aestuariivivens]|uniref:helix-turn-helix domain-containing protein n=1 Tax=Roseovarius aestuariivivens TaxID=1888910 RepID=UPI0010822E10|nr:helix-turn-helix domain-containing protein [Roseovarius aestuariivivens]
MSHKFTSKVWEDEDLSPTEKLVLGSLADHANDQGVCYPSIARLARRTGFSARTVQKAIKDLREVGKLRVDENAGPKGCNLFTVYPSKDSNAPADTPPKQMHPADPAPPQEMRDPPQLLHPPPAGAAPEPSGTVKNRQKEDHRTGDPCFSNFWEQWPLKKQGKQKAVKAFQRLSKPNKVQAIERVYEWAISWRKNNPTATDIHPATFLNEHRWLDEDQAGAKVDPRIPKYLALAQE